MNRTAPLFLGVLAIVIFFTNLGGPQLWDRDEPRNAQCAREMHERNDWVVPMFNGELRAHKPVLLYWLMMSAYSVFGVTELAARFWSAALALGTVILTYEMGRHLFGLRTGLWAAIALTTTIMFQVAARAATPDSPLIFCCALGLFLYVRAALPELNANSGVPYRPKDMSFREAAGVYGSFAIGVLAKGPVAIVLPTAIIGAFLLLAHRSGNSANRTLLQRFLRMPGYFLWTCWRMRPLTAILMLVLIAVPWYVWVGYRTDGQFLREFFLEHNLNRARNSLEGHDGPFFFYLIAILPGFFPWSIFLVPTVWQVASSLRRKEPIALSISFCLSWIVVWIGAFSLASTKLPSYVTPCYPALALLTGLFIDRWTRSETSVPAIWPRLAVGVLAAAGGAIIVVLPIVTHHYLPGDEWLGVVGMFPLGGAVAAAFALRRNDRKGVVTSVAMAASLLSLGLFAVVAQQVDTHKHSHRLLEVVFDRGEDAQLAAYGCLEPSWVFYFGRQVHDLSAPERLTKQPILEFLSRGNDHFVITTRSELARVSEQIPAGAQVLAEEPYFLENEQLVLVGYPEDIHTARRD